MVIIGGEPSVRLAHTLAVPTSPDTLLRRVRAAHGTVCPPPRYVGRDDWAVQTGQHYGTMVVDLERGRVMALRPWWDEAGVPAALTGPWSNVPVGGHVGRLKAIKRGMFGRAGFRLLRARDRGLNREVAVKLLHGNYRPDSATATLFVAERGSRPGSSTPASHRCTASANGPTAACSWPWS